MHQINCCSIFHYTTLKIQYIPIETVKFVFKTCAYFPFKTISIKFNTWKFSQKFFSPFMHNRALVMFVLILVLCARQQRNHIFHDIWMREQESSIKEPHMACIEQNNASACHYHFISRAGTIVLAYALWHASTRHFFMIATRKRLYHRRLLLFFWCINKIYYYVLCAGENDCGKIHFTQQRNSFSFIAWKI